MERYRIVEGVEIYYVTFTIVEWMPIFIEEATCKIFTDSLNFSIKNKRLGVNAYVIMPTHTHAILFDRDFDNERLKHTLDDLRKFTGRLLLDYADANLPNPFGQTFRENAKEDRQRKFWQSTQHPEGIFTEKFYRQKFNYIHLNPVRKGLVRSAVDWRFSSAGYWLRDGEAGGEEDANNDAGQDGDEKDAGQDGSEKDAGQETSVKQGVGRGTTDVKRGSTLTGTRPDPRRQYPRRYPNDVELSAIGWE